MMYNAIQRTCYVWSSRAPGKTYIAYREFYERKVENKMFLDLNIIDTEDSPTHVVHVEIILCHSKLVLFWFK